MKNMVGDRTIHEGCPKTACESSLPVVGKRSHSCPYRQTEFWDAPYFSFFKDGATAILVKVF